MNSLKVKEIQHIVQSRDLNIDLMNEGSRQTLPRKSSLNGSERELKVTAICATNNCGFMNFCWCVSAC